jgi:UDP-N-acetylglucosamine 2-epimerase (non-hydrolysing)
MIREQTILQRLDRHRTSTGEPVTIAFIAGTTAEIIKLAPVIRALEERGEDVELWNTAFHVGGLPATLADLGLPQPAVDLVPARRQRDVVRVSQVPGWALRILGTVLGRRRALRRRLARGVARPLVVVHGDTFSTVLGALMGRFLGAEVAHVEAGMRTGNIWHPMPEELNRRLVAKIATLHFAPTQHEVAALRREKAKGALVDTGANTVIDALRLAIDGDAPAIDLPDEFGLVTLHRFEMLRNGPVFTQTLEVLHEASRDLPLVMPAGNTERNRIEELGLSHLFGDRFRLVDKQPYARFMPLLARASFVVTDSGGLQQECGILGKPAAIHREAVESQQGIGQNLVLTGWDMGVLRDFLATWREHARPSLLEQFHPTEVIVAELARAGHLRA